MTNDSCIHHETDCIKLGGMSLPHSLESISFHLSFLNSKLLCGRRRKLRMFENVVLKRELGHEGEEVRKRWRKLHNEKLT